MGAIDTQQKIEALLKGIAVAIDGVLQKELGPMGFAVMIFEFHRPGISNYISNAEREDMIKALRELADRLEKKQDIPPGYGTIQ